MTQTSTQKESTLQHSLHMTPAPPPSACVHYHARQRPHTTGSSPSFSSSMTPPSRGEPAILHPEEGERGQKESGGEYDGHLLIYEGTGEEWVRDRNDEL